MYKPIVAENGELCFAWSVIDGTAISIAEFLNTHKSEPFARFVISNFHMLLGIAVETSCEEEFLSHLQKLWDEFNKMIPPTS